MNSATPSQDSSETILSLECMDQILTVMVSKVTNIVLIGIRSVLYFLTHRIKF